MTVVMTKQPSTFLYRALVDKIAHLIECGILRPGDRLPSLRHISRREKVSVTTALQAYGVLESRGYIQARPQSGYYVRVRDAPFPPEPAISAPDGRTTRVGVGDLVASVLRSSLDPRIIPLGTASPGPELLPLRALNRILASEIRRGAQSQGYSYPPGEYGLRRQIARRSMDWGSRLNLEEIVITCGATQGVDLCIRAVTRPGDLVAVESPCYFGTLLLLESLGLPVVEIPAHPRNGISLDFLDKALKSHPIRACIVSPCFSNPLGSCMSDAAKQDLAAMLARRSIPLIEDDTYGDLCYAEVRPKPVKAFDDDGLVMLCSSFSKILAPGYHIGWAAPGRFLKSVERLQMASTLGVPKIFQKTIAEFLENGAYDRHLRKIRAAVSNQSSQMIEAIGTYFPAGTKVTRPAGGLLLWVELPGNADAVQLSDKALAEGICISPGPIFSAGLHYRNYIRLNCGHPWSPAMERAVHRLGQLVRSCPTGEDHGNRPTSAQTTVSNSG